MIEKATDRVFIADTEATWKSYEVDFPTLEMNIDEAVEVEEFEINETTISSDDYSLEPLNDTPKNKIRLKTSSGQYFWIKEWEKDIRVKAKWGYSVEIPKDIQFAATVLTAGIMEKAKYEKNRGDITSESIGPHSLSFSETAKMNDLKEAKEIIKSYERMIC